MATQTKTKPKPKVKAKGSIFKNKKVLIGGGIVLLIIFYLYLKNRTSVASPASSDSSGLIPVANVTPQQAASAGTPSPNSPITSSLDPSTLDALGLSSNDYVTNTDLNSQIGGLDSDLQAAVAGITFQPQPSPATPSKTAVTNTNTKSKSVSTAIKYYTYAPGKAPKGQAANQAPAPKSGQVLKFTAGKGYYLS